jgi:colanic acid biosynthesis glycosyl transferase WcaI
LMRRFDVVSTISQRMFQRLLAKGVIPVKAYMAVNWVDMTHFAKPALNGVAAYRRALCVPDGALVALYSGNMGAKQGLECLADLARLCAQPQIPVLSDRAFVQVENGQVTTDGMPIVFVFCGNGVGRTELVTRCLGLNNVRFLDLQPAERLPELLALADVHLLPQRADAADLVMPSKLTGMLASARPVVATANPGTELASVVQICGLVVPPDNPAAMAAAVQTLAADPDLRLRLGRAGYSYALAHMDRNMVLQEFEANLLLTSR